jgi:hypothetical protein
LSEELEKNENNLTIFGGVQIKGGLDYSQLNLDFCE